MTWKRRVKLRERALEGAEAACGESEIRTSATAPDQQNREVKRTSERNSCFMLNRSQVYSFF